MNKKESISVIIPAYNSARFIGAALESVLGQTVPPDEIIVVDDGSTDETKVAVNKYKGKIRYIYQKNSGPGAARNRGLQEAKGSYITFIDADDIWHKQKLENQIQEFKKRKDVDVVLGLTYRCQFASYEDINLEQAKKNPEFALVLGCSLVKKSVFEQVGNFDEEIILGDDSDWFFRVYEENISISVQRSTVLYYRLHDSNLTKNKKLKKKSMLRILKKAKGRKGYAKAANSYALDNTHNMEEFIEMWNTASPKTIDKNE